MNRESASARAAHTCTCRDACTPCWTTQVSAADTLLWNGFWATILVLFCHMLIALRLCIMQCNTQLCLIDVLFCIMIVQLCLLTRPLCILYLQLFNMPIIFCNASFLMALWLFYYEWEIMPDQLFYEGALRSPWFQWFDVKIIEIRRSQRHLVG